MKNKYARPIETKKWHEIRETLAPINPGLTKAIDAVDPGNAFPLIKARYLYGDTIVQAGKVQLPIAADLHQLKLDYTQSIPVFCVLTQSAEVFLDPGHRIIPLKLFGPGSCLGLFEMMNYLSGKLRPPHWSVTAGARSIFMLPKINEKSGLKRLSAAFGLPWDIQLSNLNSHWHAFKHLAQHDTFSQPWSCEVLFFTQPWFEQKTPKWQPFKDYLIEQAWQQAQFAIGRMQHGRDWEFFLDGMYARRLTPTPYLLDQIKHLGLIASGSLPGFIPAVPSQIAAPTHTLTQIFLDIYELKNYHPTFMHPSNELSSNQPLYYSLSFPTLLEGSTKDLSTVTMMSHLRNIKLFINTIKKNTKRSLPDQIIHQTQFDYFHVEKDHYGEIFSTDTIYAEDPGFQINIPHCECNLFCSTSPFWRGCIRLKPQVAKTVEDETTTDCLDSSSVL